MKRFHVHIAVNDLAASIAFYSKLFGQAPTKVQPDYAKWMLEDPRVNFAISARGHAVGVNHFGMQVDSPEELAAIRQLADAASGDTTLNQGETTCCYANSDKHWVVDPQGLAWEHYYTVADAETFGADSVSQAGACCEPAQAKAGAAHESACCVPPAASGKANATKGGCCG